MKKWNQLERVSIFDGSTMTLAERDGHYVIHVDGRELMSTRHPTSEERLAEVACEGLMAAKAPLVLIGGLGLGFTLRAALANLPKDAKVQVAELIPEVVDWNRNPSYPLAASSLSDPRTEVLIGDVGRIIADSKPKQFDAIMLDADNGTTSMNSAGNDRLYEAIGVSEVFRALKSKGFAVYWSAQSEPLFVRRMEKAGFKVQVQDVRAHPSGGSKHVLLIGQRN